MILLSSIGILKEVGYMIPLNIERRPVIDATRKTVLKKVLH